MKRRADHPTPDSMDLTRRQFLKRLVAAGVTLPAASAFLAACGVTPNASNGTTGNQAASTAATSAASTAPAATSAATTTSSASGEVTFWYVSGSESTTKILEGAASRLMEQNSGIKVTGQAFQNDPFKTKLQVAMGSDSPPDVWQTFGGGVLAEYVRAGAVLDITNQLNTDGWKERFAPAVLDLMKVDGKYYGVPLDVAGAFFWYNKDIFAANNLTPPQTWDDVIGVVSTLKSKGITPIALANKSKWPGAFYFNYLVLRICGDDFLGNVLAGKANFNDPGVVEAGRRLQDLVKAGAFPDGFNGLEQDTGGARQLLYAEKAAMELMGNWMPRIASEENPGFEKKLDFFLFPTVANGKGSPSSLLGGADNGYAVSQKSKAPEAAVELLRYLSDETVRDTFATNSRVPAMVGATIPDERTKKVADAFQKAAYLQLYWDQFLPPALGQAQLDVSQNLLSLNITPEQAAQQLDAAAKSNQQS